MDADETAASEGALTDGSDSPPQQRSTGRPILLGSLIGALIPLSLGAYGVYQDAAYAATLPPDVARCGMGAMGAYLTALVGGPTCGLIGGLLGSLMSRSSRSA